MSYTALYRKFRPLTFEEIVGQEHITRTLRNQIIAGRVGHAYLFNGGRGTGKTSAAKVLARAINCLNPQDGEPCNECEVCKAALAGSLTDIVEMDAASNNSVEDVRSIREEVNFLPTVAKYRVYIIDEVHMLSTGAFNALLKTLEEPPAHVKFILATTEPQKLPATILSRCQRFDFKKISNENIEKRLQFVCDESKIEITPEALKLIAVLSEGAMRDALSILERCVQDGEDKIDEDKIKDLVGIPKLTIVSNIVKAIFTYNVEDAIIAVNSVLDSGKDLNNLLWEMIKYIKDILVYKVTQNIQVYSEAEITVIKELSEMVTKERLLQIIYDLSELENDMKWSSQKSILFQVEVIKLCSKLSGSTTVESVDNLSQNCAKPVNTPIQNQSYPQTAVDKKENGISQGQNVKKVQQSLKANEGNIGAKSKNVAEMSRGFGMKNWGKIVGDLKQSGKILLYTNLMNTNAVEINDMTVGIEFPGGLTPFAKSVLEKPENIQELSRLVSMEYGKDMRVKVLDGTQNIVKPKEVGPIENMASDLDIPINIIDE